MKIPYYPGCTLKSTAKEFENTAIAAMQVLGVELVEIPDWTCCGVVMPLAQDDVMHLVAPARNFVRVQDMGEKRMVVLCTMCYNTLKWAAKRLEDEPDNLETINAFMYLENDYKGGVKVYHLLEILRDEIGWDKIKAAVKNPLRERKIAPYYGCLLLRPRGIGIDHPENPTIVDNLLKALGATPVKFARRTTCCGSYQAVNRPDVVERAVRRIVESAVESGAEALVTSCPLCHFNLTEAQKRIASKEPNFKTIPVYYFTELMAEAFGVK